MVSQNGSAGDMRHERDRFLAFAFTHADILLELDKSGHILFIDGATRNLLGHSPANLQGMHLSQIIAEIDRKKAVEMISHAAAGRRIANAKLHLANAASGEERAFALSGYVLPSIDNHIFLTLSAVREEVAPEDIGNRDVKTGLLREQAFTQAVSHLLHEIKNRQDKKLQLTLLHLPEVEALGEDHSLKANNLMEAICGRLREASVDHDMAARIEPGVYSLLHDASVKPHQLAGYMEDAAREFLGDEHPFPVMVRSLEMDPPAICEADCLRALRYMLYQFCDDNVDNFNLRTLSDSYQQMLDETVKKITVFKQTVHESGFEVALQPIVDMHRQELHCFEALVRFPEGEKTFKNPFQFITFGEETGIIGDFDLAMCQKVLSLLEDFSQNGDYPRISVNLSGKSLSSNLFRDTLRVMLKDYPELRRQMLFEITESAKIGDLENANEFIQELRAAGHQCCLDDFGVGESSFEYIRFLEVDYVKIDGSYVRQSASSKRGRHVLKAIIHLCAELEMMPIGEMVEDEATADFLRQCGVSLGQGWHFGKPTTDHAEALKQYYQRDKQRRANHVVTTSPANVRTKTTPSASVTAALAKAKRVPSSWGSYSG